jgi:hypothetical protein
VDLSDTGAMAKLAGVVDSARVDELASVLRLLGVAYGIELYDPAGELVRTPLYGNTQLLWYRKSVLQRAGVDPAAGPVTWDQLIDGASRAGVTFAAQGRRNESLTVCLRAQLRRLRRRRHRRPAQRPIPPAVPA